VPAPVIVARDLVKRYGEFAAVDGISFEVAPGESFGLLGPNGAGKSTTMRMVGAVSTRTAGDLSILGLDPDAFGPEIRSQLGVVPQADNLDTELRVRENLLVYGRYFGLPAKLVATRADELLAFAQLEDKGKAKVDSLSGGMKRRLTIARALINDPRVLLLDEPTTGLDPQARHILWDRLFRLKEQGTTLLLTTHYMDEAQRLCDRIVIIDQGRILDQGSPAELIGRHVKGHVFEVQKPLPRGFIDGRWDHEDIGDAVLYYVETPRQVIEALPEDTLFRHRPANLEDVFLRLTGRQLRET
jgi:lipooligosaccharide transport system ATP-binding protein